MFVPPSRCVLGRWLGYIHAYMRTQDFGLKLIPLLTYSSSELPVTDGQYQSNYVILYYLSPSVFISSKLNLHMYLRMSPGSMTGCSPSPEGKHTYIFFFFFCYLSPLWVWFLVNCAESHLVVQCCIVLICKHIFTPYGKY